MRFRSKRRFARGAEPPDGYEIENRAFRRIVRFRRRGVGSPQRTFFASWLRTFSAARRSGDFADLLEFNDYAADTSCQRASLPAPGPSRLPGVGAPVARRIRSAIAIRTTRTADHGPNSITSGKGLRIMKHIALVVLAVAVVGASVGCGRLHRSFWNRGGCDCPSEIGCDGQCDSGGCANGQCAMRQPKASSYGPRRGLFASKKSAGPPPAGPPVAGVSYPYYTTRGPSDFLAADPTNIGR